MAVLKAKYYPAGTHATDSRFPRLPAAARLVGTVRRGAWAGTRAFETNQMPHGFPVEFMAGF